MNAMTPPTEAERCAGQPWAMAILGSMIFALVSYTGMALCYYLSPHHEMRTYGVWFLATWFITRGSMFICMRQLQRIRPDPSFSGRRYLISNLLEVGFFGFMLWLVWDVRN